MRVEHDFLGEMNIDDNFYYGIQTIRNLRASNVTGQTIGNNYQELLFYLASIKQAAAMANEEIGLLENNIASAITQACTEIMQGNFKEHFPADILTGGGGIAINMNMNEVVANRANELICGQKGGGMVHANTHVNMGQSTNDTLPSAMHLAIHALLENVCTQAENMEKTFINLARSHENTIKLGRTCLQDALPVSFGQVFRGHAGFFNRQKQHIKSLMAEVLELSLGGTAVGTGAGCTASFVDCMYSKLANITNLPIKKHDNLFDALSHADIYTKVSSSLKMLATGLSKIASDLRLQASGPRAGFGEISLPELLPGSSIMPGKINPVLPELIIQIYFQVCGNDVAVSMAAERGELELNVWEALIYKNIHESSKLLEKGMALFAEQCLKGLAINQEHCYKQATESTALAALVASAFGYETGSMCAHASIDEQKTILTVVIEKGLLPKGAAEKLLDPKNLLSSQRFEDCLQSLKSEGLIP